MSRPASGSASGIGNCSWGRLGSIWPWTAAASSGILLMLAYPPFAWEGLAWIALAPLTAAVWFAQPWLHKEPLRLFLLGAITGLGCFAGSLHWLWTVTIPGWLVLGLYLAIYPGVWAVFLGWVARPQTGDGGSTPPWENSWRNLLAALLAAAAWCGLEWLRGNLFTGFGWNPLAVALVNNLPMIQFADHTGAAGISFLLVLTNVVIAVSIRRLASEIARKRMRAHFDFSLTVVLVAAAFGYGVRTLLAPAPRTREITFGAIQANIPMLEKRDPAQEQKILDSYVHLSKAALAFRPDLLVWPEAATPQALFLDQRNWDAVNSIAVRHDGDFLLGTLHSDANGDFNSAVLLTHHGSKATLYHKIHLVPFGEYIPFRKSFPLFAWVTGDLVPGDFTFGTEPTVFEMTAQPVRLAPLICFEDTLGDLTRQFVQRGAQLLVTVTNDAWFLKSAGSEQHRANAVLRTIENRLPLIRAANTGVTCALDHLGRETHRLREADGNTFFQGFLIGSVHVPLEPPETFYTLHGEFFAKMCLTVTVFAIFVALGRAILKNRRITR